MNIAQNNASDDLMRVVNSLPAFLKRTIKLIAALKSKMDNNPELAPYITPMLELLTNCLNLRKDPILTELKPKLEELLLTYIFDMIEFIQNTIVLEVYQDKHLTLVCLNDHIKHSIRVGHITDELQNIIN
jgi:hypothetical protein